MVVTGSVSEFYQQTPIADADVEQWLGIAVDSAEADQLLEGILAGQPKPLPEAVIQLLNNLRKLAMEDIKTELTKEDVRKAFNV